MSTTRLVMTVGILAPGRAPIFTSRTVNYTDLSIPLTAFSNILTTSPFAEFVPVPEPEPLPEEQPL